MRASVLNVRSGPSVQHNIMGTVKKDDEVFLYEESDNWVRISLDERWVSKSYLTIE
ncbi:MAG: SH3 domain-containing protein [Saprospiraceae bacterium]|nr:SH3 domain-containing protein [Saprospiraceae bacterium]